MNGQNDFEKQVEREERAYTEPEQEEFAFEGGESTRAGSAIVEKIRELVRKGNVTRIVIKKNDNVLLNIPLNVGIVGGLFGVAAAPWAVIAAAVATAGFACRVELIRDDGEVVRVSGRDLGENIGEKAKDVGAAVKDMGNVVMDMGAAVVDSIRDAVKAEDADIEVVIEEEPAADFSDEPAADFSAGPEEINIPVDDAPAEE